MVDRTRTGVGATAAEVVAEVILEWLDEFGDLAAALVTLRRYGDASTCAALLGAPPVWQLREEWDLWEEWAGISSDEADARLVGHLPRELVVWLRFGLWGIEPGDRGANPDRSAEGWRFAGWYQ